MGSSRASRVARRIRHRSERDDCALRHQLSRLAEPKAGQQVETEHQHEGGDSGSEHAALAGAEGNPAKDHRSQRVQRQVGADVEAPEADETDENESAQHRKKTREDMRAVHDLDVRGARRPGGPGIGADRIDIAREHREPKEDRHRNERGDPDQHRDRQHADTRLPDVAQNLGRFARRAKLAEGRDNTPKDQHHRQGDNDRRRPELRDEEGVGRADGDPQQKAEDDEDRLGKRQVSARQDIAHRDRDASERKVQRKQPDAERLADDGDPHRAPPGA